MPFTPFHFGPGAVVKAVIPRQFSFSVFCFAQVVMDTEVLVNMARGGERWHGYFHTYVGAVGVGMISLLIGWPICQQTLRWWHSEHNLPLKEYYNPSPEIRPIAAISGAFVGSFSHVLLDGIIHQDTRPGVPDLRSYWGCGLREISQRRVVNPMPSSAGRIGGKGGLHFDLSGLRDKV